MTETQALRSCKICGSKPKLITAPVRPYGIIEDPNDRLYYYQCPVCGFRTRSGCIMVRRKNQTEEQAIEQAFNYWQEQESFEYIEEKAEQAYKAQRGVLGDSP